jgi:hypothetical protein
MCTPGPVRRPENPSNRSVPAIAAIASSPGASGHGSG